MTECFWCNAKISGDIKNPDTHLAWDWLCCKSCWDEMVEDGRTINSTDAGHGAFLAYLAIQDKTGNLSKDEQMYFLWCVSKEACYRMGVLMGHIQEVKC